MSAMPKTHSTTPLPKPVKREIKDVWIEYKKTRSESLRN